MAARLAELGRPADLFRDDGLARLRAEARGSRERLHALLASTLFLASTEDAPAIGAEHVQRAARSLPASPPGWLRGRAGTPLRRLAEGGVRRSGFPQPPHAHLALAAGAALALAPGLWWLITPHGGGGRQDQAAAVRMAPARAVPAPLAPAAHTPPPPPPAEVLPAQPPAKVIIHYVPGDPAAALRVQSIAAGLRRLHLDTGFDPAPRGSVRSASLGFRYEEDRALAARVAAAAGGGLSPQLLPAPARTTFPQPGTIEIFVP